MNGNNWNRNPADPVFPALRASAPSALKGNGNA
jgi:hypothetical protein